MQMFLCANNREQEPKGKGVLKSKKKKKQGKLLKFEKTDKRGWIELGLDSLK